MSKISECNERAFISRSLAKTKFKARTERNLEFDLTLDDVMYVLREQKYKCALTGWNLEFVNGGDFHGTNPRGCTIDRIDNNRGYVKDNIQLACCMANIIRSDMPISQFADLATAVSKKLAVAN